MPGRDALDEREAAAARRAPPDLGSRRRRRRCWRSRSERRRRAVRSRRGSSAGRACRSRREIVAASWSVRRASVAGAVATAATAISASESPRAANRRAQANGLTPRRRSSPRPAWASRWRCQVAAGAARRDSAIWSATDRRRPPKPASVANDGVRRWSRRQRLARVGRLAGGGVAARLRSTWSSSSDSSSQTAASSVAATPIDEQDAGRDRQQRDEVAGDRDRRPGRGPRSRTRGRASDPAAAFASPFVRTSGRPADRRSR